MCLPLSLTSAFVCLILTVTCLIRDGKQYYSYLTDGILRLRENK